MSEQAVLVTFKYQGATLDALFSLEEELEQCLAKLDVGEYDGYDMAANLDDGCLYFYGADADSLLEAVLPILLRHPSLENMVATLRFGPLADNTPERVQAIG